MAQGSTAQGTTIGIDIAKNVVCIHGVDARGHIVVKKRLARQKVLPFMAQLPPCLLGMEASGVAHYWAREFTQLGHTVKIPAASSGAFRRKLSVMLGESVPQTP